MKQFYANGIAMSQILGFSKPKEEVSDQDRAEKLYKKRLARLRQMESGVQEGEQVLSMRRSFDSAQGDIAQDDGEIGGEVQIKAGLSIPPHTNTSFVPYVTSVTKQCLQPMAYGLKLIAIIFFVSGLFTDALAQSRQDRGTAVGVGEIRPLMVGQKVSDDFWTREHLFYVDGDTVRQSLVAHRGKQIIINFWSTYCGPCLLGMKHIAYFRAHYGSQLSVIMVNSMKTGDDLDRIRTFEASERFRQTGMEHLESIIGDHYHKELLPHNGYPHYVWINKAGVVQAKSFKFFLDIEDTVPFVNIDLRRPDR